MKIKKYLQKYKLDEIEFVYLLAVVVFLVALVLLAWLGYGYWSAKKAGQDKNFFPLDLVFEAEECEFRRILDGVCVDKEEDVNPKIVAVMIENHPDARPQSGLAEASIVYEVPVEANYTRFLAIYPEDQKVDDIGPVRSARPYFLEWVSEYGDAMYMHVGGSPQALDLIKQFEIFDLNEFYRGWYYWRDDHKLAPHNVYTSSKMWDKALDDYEEYYTTDEYTPWKFVTSTDSEEWTSPITKIRASFLPPVYEALWEYNTSTKRYERYQMDELHRNQDKKKITADTVIVQRVQTLVLDNIGRKKIYTTTVGDSLVFFDGKVIEGKWGKESRGSRTIFYDQDGEEIKLKPGKIWIEVVPQDGYVDYQ